MNDFSYLEISLEDVKAATNNFTDKPIGSGGFGAVYKGELLLPTGPKTVAIKRLDRKFGQGDVEFWKEILMLSDLKHENLSPLLYFCREGDERILVYEYASGGSLDKRIADPSLTYLDRLEICIGAGNGIAYLHDPKFNTQQQRVLHRDIKSSNILLDDKGSAKVSDLGLSKFGPANQARTFVVSNVVGTPGYVDPEYLETGILSKESDVYSFGVVLLEVICGKLCYKYDKANGLVSEWKKCCDEDRLDDIIFPDLIQEKMDPESLWTYVTIAKRCLNRNRKDRPAMTEVVKELEFALHLQLNSKHDNFNPTKMPTSYRLVEEFNHLRIGFEDIKLATNNFSDDNLIEHGVFGWIYKGELSFPEGKDKVFFKRLDRGLGEGIAKFWKEVSKLSKNQHSELDSLLKFCCEGDEMILVFKYTPLGYLDMSISEPNFSWKQCLRMTKKIFNEHVDEAKQDKQVLEEDWRAKVFGFGRSNVVPNNQPQTFATSRVGTIGHSDLSEESHVYGFGVGLVKMLRRILPTVCRNGDTSVFVRKWKTYYDMNRLDEFILPGLKGQIDPSSLNTFLSIAYQCVNEDPKERPNSTEILEDLEGAIELQEDFEATLESDIEATLESESLEMSSISKYQNPWPFFKGVLVEDNLRD